MAEARRLPLVVAPDAAAAKIRLGLLWFVAGVAAALLSQLLLALLLGVVAAVATDEVLRRHRRSRPGSDLLRDPLRLPGLLWAATIPLAAVNGVALLAGVLASGVVLALGYRLLWVGSGGELAEVAILLGAALVFGLAAAGPVLVAEIAPGAAAILLALVGVYDASDFVIGTDARAEWEGPLAGAVAVAVCGFGGWVVTPPALGGHGAFGLAVTVAAFAPFGPPAVGVLLGPDAAEPARFVRRLDSLVLCGPIAAWVVRAVAVG